MFVSYRKLRLVSCRFLIFSVNCRVDKDRSGQITAHELGPALSNGQWRTHTHTQAHKQTDTLSLSVSLCLFAFVLVYLCFLFLLFVTISSASTKSCETFSTKSTCIFCHQLLRKHFHAILQDTHVGLLDIRRLMIDP